MWLRIYYWQSGGYWIGKTRYVNHEKSWIAENLKSLKQKAGPFLASAHRVGAMMEVSRLSYVEGEPNDDTVYLISDPQKRKYTKKNKYNFERYNKPKFQRASAKGVVVDGVPYRSVQEAEEICGFKRDTLGQALRHGKTESMGHSVSYQNPTLSKTVVENKPKNEPTQAKSDEDNTTYLYKEEGGYLKIYRKTLCNSFKVSKFN